MVSALLSCQSDSEGSKKLTEVDKSISHRVRPASDSMYMCGYRHEQTRVWNGDAYVIKNEFHSEFYDIVVADTFAGEGRKVDPYDPADFLNSSISLNDSIVLNLCLEHTDYRAKFVFGDDSLLCVATGDTEIIIVFGTPFYCGGTRCADIICTVIVRDGRKSRYGVYSTNICSSGEVRRLITKRYFQDRTVALPVWKGDCFDSIVISDVEWIPVMDLCKGS